MHKQEPGDELTEWHKGGIDGWAGLEKTATQTHARRFHPFIFKTQRLL